MGQSETHSAGGLRKHEDGGRLHGKARAFRLPLVNPPEKSNTDGGRCRGGVKDKRKWSEKRNANRSDVQGIRGEWKEVCVGGAGVHFDFGGPLGCGERGREREGGDGWRGGGKGEAEICQTSHLFTRGATCFTRSRCS